MGRGEIRQNKATRQWVIYSPARRKRPHDFQVPHGEKEVLSAYKPSCPFCQGNEGMLPQIIWKCRMIIKHGRPEWYSTSFRPLFPKRMRHFSGRRHERVEEVWLFQEGRVSA